MSRRKTIRFGDYIQAMSIDSQKIPYHGMEFFDYLLTLLGYNHQIVWFCDET